jgi:hypothetical protein
MSVVHTDGAGNNYAGVNTAPPNTGTDVGLQVYASLGAGVLQVSDGHSLNTGATDANTQRVVQATGSTINTGQVSVGASATSIIAANANRIKLTIYNTGTTAVYVGNSAVTATTGSLLPGIVGYPVIIRCSAAIYGITSSGSQTVTYIEESQ